MNTSTKADRAPLSQRSGRAKLLIGMPLFLAAVAATYITPIADIAKLIAAAAGAYVIVGIIETIAGSSLSRLAKSWDQLPSWKQGLISTVVIVTMIVGSIALLPTLSRVVG
jgi:hypothetical protein